MKVWPSRRLSSTNFNIPSLNELNHLLQFCSNSRSLNQGKQTHQQITINGLDHEPFMTTKLVQMYADCNDIASVNHLFDKLSQPNVFAWTAVLAFYTRTGMSSECLRAYCKMNLSGVLPDRYVFPKVIRACAQSSCLDIGTQIHKEVICLGDDLNLEVCNSLIDMYSKCSDVWSARRVFDTMTKRDLLSWNSMISCYVYKGFLSLAVDLSKFMSLDGFEPDLVTSNTMMDAYCRMGRCDEAMEIFGQIKEPNVISWTTLITGHLRTGKHEVAIGIFRDMMHKAEVFADVDCLSSVLVSCREIKQLKFGQQLHAYGLRTESEVAFYKSAGPALLTLYSRCRRTEDARNVFKFMDKSDVVSWNAMILGFLDLGMRNSSFECFKTMQHLYKIQCDQTTVSTILPTCDLTQGKQIHAQITKSSLISSVLVFNALIHMYSIHGSISTAYSLFTNMKNKDIVSWNTMIRGFGIHGFGQDSLKLLHKMKQNGLSPNSITFTSVLSACSHSGLLQEGFNLFNQMFKDFGFNPRTEHYACVVDMLGRGGRLDDAIEFIKAMPVEADKRIWGSLLAASRSQQNIRVGVLASEKLVELEPENAGHYVTLYNMYARAGRWNDGMKVREVMESKRLVKVSGYSWIS